MMPDDPTARQDIDQADNAGELAPPTAAEMERAAEDAFAALEFAHKYGDRYPAEVDAVNRRAWQRD